MGISSAEEYGDCDFEQLQSLADKRLLLRQTVGRNRICASDATPGAGKNSPFLRASHPAFVLAYGRRARIVVTQMYALGCSL